MGKSIICTKIVNYLRGITNKEIKDKDKANEKIEDKINEKKNNKSKKKNNRIADPDKMTSKILNNLAFSFREATNSFREFKIRQIETIKYELINKKIKADFILEYLRQPLYLILSNVSSQDTTLKSNKSIIEEILNLNKNNKSKEVITHLNLTVQKCLDYFRYKEENPRFKYKLVDYLIKEFASQKKKGDINFAKAYIASLLLVAYNFELFFQIRKKNSKNNKKKKNKLFFVKEEFINNKRSRNEKYNPKESKRNSNINDININASNNKTLGNQKLFVTTKVFQENQISSKIEEINKSNNQSLIINP